MAFVKARMHLDQSPDGTIISIIYENTSSNRPLQKSIQSLGHTILSSTANDSSLPIPQKTDPVHGGTLQVINLKVQVNI